MAENEEEEEKAEIISAETLIEWERIQSPRVHDQSSPSPDPSNREVWSMVHEPQRSVIFPPINHEGLHFFSSTNIQHDVREIDLDDRVGPPFPLQSPRPRPASRDALEGWWWDVGLEHLRLKVTAIVSSLQNFAATRGLLRSYHFPISVAPVAGSMVLLLLFLRFRRQRRLRKEDLGDLIRVIKEKDEKIHQLLHQIARLNEVLLVTHHGVPISRTV